MTVGTGDESQDNSTGRVRAGPGTGCAFALACGSAVASGLWVLLGAFVVFGSRPHAWGALGLYFLLLPTAALALGALLVNAVVFIIGPNRTAVYGLFLTGGACLVLLSGYLIMQQVRWETC